ncbi:hypothetical protein JCM11251_007261 [Rhodosporidiobolus azoricus]
MLPWFLKLLILFLNLRASHKALRPSDKGKNRSQLRTGERGGEVKRDSRTAERDRRKRQKEQLANWVVWVCFCLVERVSDRTVGLVLPLYGTVKALALLTVLLWRNAGSQLIFDKVIKPVVRPYERPVDLVGHVLGEILHILTAAFLFVPSWAGHKWRSRRREADVPSILRNLRQPHNPPLAHSLADSIDHANERAKEDSDRINARLSRPVQVSLQPFRPQKRPPAPPRPASLPVHQASTDLPPPPAASTAPFRPVPVAVPGSSKPRHQPPRPQPAQPVASTSRLPVPQLPRQPFQPTTSGSTPSLYPSLAAVASPIQPIDLYLRTASSASSVKSYEEAPAAQAAKELRRSSGARAAATVKGKGRTRPREDSTDTDREANGGNNSSVKPPAKRTKRRSSRLSKSAPGPSHAPEVEEEVERDAMDVEQESPARSPTPPPSSLAANASRLPPGTPAPPGAFSFLSPQPASRESSPPSIRTMTLDDSAADERATPKKSVSTARRRTRQSLAAVTREKEESAAEQADSLDSHSQRSTPRKRVSAAALEKKAPTATPRQKALGAIAQLSRDLLLDESDDDVFSGSGVGSSAKKRKTSVLARGGTAKGKERAVEPARTRRTRGETVEGDDEDYANVVEDRGTAKISPAKKRKAVRAPEVEAEKGDAKERPSRLNQPAARIASSTSRTSTSASSTVTNPTRSSRIAAKGTSRSTATLPRSRSRLAVSTAASSSSRAPSPAPADESDDLLVLPSRSTTTNGKAKPPARRAKRVLLGRGGSAALEEEEEVEGVPMSRLKGVGKTGRREVARLFSSFIGSSFDILLPPCSALFLFPSRLRSTFEMAILGFHHLGTFLLLASSILLLIPCITAPAVNDLYMLRVRDSAQAGYVSLGIWGACVIRSGFADACTRARVRYRPSRIIAGFLGVVIFPRTGDGITGALLLTPVLCGTTFFAFLIAICSYRVGFLAAAFVTGWVFLGTLVLVIVQATIFGTLRSNSNEIPGVDASYGSGFWCTISALPVLFLAMCCTFAACFSDRRKERGYF